MLGILKKNKENANKSLIALTKDEQLLEIRRCKNDPSYFARNYVYIKNKDDGAVKFRLWDFQESVLKDFKTHNLNIVLKARQLGLTELASLYVLWYTLFHRDKNVVIVSKNRKSAANVIKRIKYAYKKLPDWLKVTRMVADNVHSIELDNDSIIFADATTSNAGRGEAVSLFVVDEAAFIDCFEELWTSVRPTLDKGACIILSTPNGASNTFYDLFIGAPDNGFNPIKLNWDVHPQRDQEWFDRTKASMSTKAFAREYMCNFTLSGDTVIDAEDIERHATRIKDPIETAGNTNPLKEILIWKRQNLTDRYCIGADCARGDGEDFSAFHVINVDTHEIVAEYKGKIKVDRFAQLLVHVAQLYGSALIVVENNSMGLAVLMKLIDLKYPNIYWEEKGTHSYSEGYVDFENDDDIVPGFTTTMSSRILMLDLLEESVRLDKITTYSKRMIDEFRNFIYENGKPKARKGTNDDLVMALAIGLYVASLVFPNKDSDIELRKKILENFKVMESFASTKMHYEKGYDPNKDILRQSITDPYKYKYGEKTELDFRCLVDTKTNNDKDTKPIENKGINFLGFLR